jgi:hypothetical protein
MITGTMVDELERRNARSCPVTLCIGGGMGVRDHHREGLESHGREHHSVGTRMPTHRHPDARRPSGSAKRDGKSTTGVDALRPSNALSPRRIRSPAFVITKREVSPSFAGGDLDGDGQGAARGRRRILQHVEGIKADLRKLEDAGSRSWPPSTAPRSAAGLEITLACHPPVIADVPGAVRRFPG